MPCGWESNCRSGVALATRDVQTSVVYPPIRAHGPGRRAPRLHSSWGVAHFTLRLCDCSRLLGEREQNKQVRCRLVVSANDRWHVTIND